MSETNIKINIKKLPKSEVEIEGALDSVSFEEYFSKALKKIGENLELPGFRKGKVPEIILLSKVPEMQILNEMAELALNDFELRNLQQGFSTGICKNLKSS